MKASLLRKYHPSEPSWTFFFKKGFPFPLVLLGLGHEAHSGPTTSWI